MIVVSNQLKRSRVFCAHDFLVISTSNDCCVRVPDTLAKPTVLISEPMASDTPAAEESERYGALLLVSSPQDTTHSAAL